MGNLDEKIIVAHIMGKWNGGGVESVVMNYYKNIDRNRIQFHFLCDEDSTDIPYEEIEKLGGKVIVIPPYQKLFKYQKELYRIFKENNYKIIHSHINALSVFPLRIAKKAGVPIRIAHSHSTSNKKEWKKNILKMILRPFSKLYANNYFACTEYAGKWLFGKKVVERKELNVINNAIDLKKFEFNENTREDLRKELGIKEDVLVIGHVGRFMKQKNHEFLIDVFEKAIKQDDNIYLILVGQGPLEDKIKEMAKEKGIEYKILFLGQRNDVNKLYQAMDIFVLPSLYEGLRNGCNRSRGCRFKGHLLRKCSKGSKFNSEK